MRSCSLACCLSSAFLLVATFHTVARARDAIVIAPGSSIEQSVAHARDARAQQPGTITLRLRGGVYRLDQPIVLTPADSNLIVEGAAGETPVISGGRRIEG